ncbi:MAG: hypothetical protein PHO46_00660 [Thermoguttaceae bacterium]|jgi:hypothetical protein|nr:hypothetical protein [Thermoguttaceae bacterium]
MMKKAFLLLAFLCASSAALAQDSDQPQTYDPNATAESLGLEPYRAPEGFFPVFPWDHFDEWGDIFQSLEEGFKSMAECNCTLSSFVDDERGVQAAKENGLKCIYELRLDPSDKSDGNRQGSFDARNFSEEEIQEQIARLDALIKEQVELTKDDPDVIGYYLCDEPGSYHFRLLAVAVDAVKKYAPGKLAYINLFPGYASTIGANVDSQLGTYSYREYLERFVQEVKPQLLSYDNYMLDYSDNMRNIHRGVRHFIDLFEVRAVAQKYDLPFWFIGSSMCLRDESSPAGPMRYAYQMYTALAAGAEGITWFLFYPREEGGTPIDEYGNKTVYWSYLRVINEQMKALGTYLLAYANTACGMTPLYTPEEAPNLPQFPELPDNVLRNVRLKYSGYAEALEPKLMIGEFAQKDGENVAALAVNLNTSATERLYFEFPEGYKTLKVVSPIDGSESVVTDKQFERGFWILPGHGVLFVFEK